MPWEPKSSFHRGWFFSLANGAVLVRSLEYHILPDPIARFKSSQGPGTSENWRKQLSGTTAIFYYHLPSAICRNWSISDSTIIQTIMRLLLFQAARCPGQRRGWRRFSQQNKFQSLRRSSRSEKNKNKIFEYRRLSSYHVSGKEIFDLYGNGNASLQFRCYPSAGVFITWTSLPYLIIICKSSNENKIFYHRWKLGTKTVERSGNRWISLF